MNAPVPTHVLPQFEAPADVAIESDILPESGISPDLALWPESVSAQAGQEGA